MPHLSEQTLWALLGQSAPTTVPLFFFFFFFFFKTDDSLGLSEIEVTQNSLCVSGTACEGIAWAPCYCVLAGEGGSCAFMDTAVQPLLKRCALPLGQEAIR